MENIKTVIKDFVELIEKGCSSIEENEQKLKHFCDKILESIPNINLNSIKTFTNPNIALSQKISSIKQLVLERFPHFGHYSFTGGNNEENETSNTKLVTGNVIDDITAITNVFYEILWRFENIDTNDALFYLEDNFKYCWGGNFKNLQIYLDS